jgi:serine/threonine protein kinase
MVHSNTEIFYPESSSELSSDAKHFLKGLLESDPTKRFNSVQTLTNSFLNTDRPTSVPYIPEKKSFEDFSLEFLQNQKLRSSEFFAQSTYDPLPMPLDKFSYSPVHLAPQVDPASFNISESGIQAVDSNHEQSPVQRPTNFSVDLPLKPSHNLKNPSQASTNLGSIGSVQLPSIGGRR